MKKKILSMLTAASMLASMSGMVVRAEESDYADVYKITFNKGTVSSGTKSPTADTMLKWVSEEGYTRGFSVANANNVSGGSWALVGDVPSKGEADDKALKVVSTPNNNYTSNYMSITNANFNSSYNTADLISCGTNGYTVFSFDFYSDFLTKISLQAGRVWRDLAQTDEEEVEVLEENSSAISLFELDTNGDLKAFGSTIKTLSAEDYTNSWHNVKIVFTADNKYQLFIDEKPINDFTDVSSYGSGYSFRGIKEFRLFNIHVPGYASTKYYDNFRYSVVKSADTTVTHSDNKINRNFAVSEGYIFADPQISVGDFTSGLSAKYMAVDSEAVVVDSEGNVLDSSANMSEAAALKLTNELGISCEIKIVTATNSVTDDPSKLTITDKGGMSTTTGAFWWSYSSDYYNERGYKAELVDAFGGKETGDTSLKLTHETLTDKSSSAAFLDIYPSNIAGTEYVENTAPVTFSYSLYLGMENATGNSLQGRYNNAVYVSNGFIPDRWNRYAVTLYPNSREYKYYINGRLAGAGELSESVSDVESNERRFRFRFQSATVGNYIVVDDVQAVYGVYEPEIKVSLTSASGADVKATAVTSSENNADLVNTMLVAAEYDDAGKLINVAVSNGTPTPSEVSCTLVNVANKDKVKAFLWDKSSLTPIVDVKTIID